MALPKLSSIVRKVLGKEEKEKASAPADVPRTPAASPDPAPSPAPDAMPAPTRRVSDGPGMSSQPASSSPAADKSSSKPASASPAKPAQRVRRKFVYDGYGYLWYPNEGRVFITMGPDYKARSPWFEVRAGSKSYIPITKQYSLAVERKRSGKYPGISVGDTDQLLRGAVSRFIQRLRATDWFSSASKNAQAALAGSAYTSSVADAVMEFQKFVGLDPDGEVGEMTHDAVIMHGGGAVEEPEKKGDVSKGATTNLKRDPSGGYLIDNPDLVVPTLKEAGWTSNRNQVVVIDGKKQEITLRTIADNKVVMRFPCSTAKTGFSNQSGGLHGGTATGLHQIVAKEGDGEPLYTVFARRKSEGGLSNPMPVVSPETGNKVVLGGPNDGANAAVLTRVILMDGMQPENRLTYERNIYIHGTNRERDLGKPASGGCIRVANENVVKLFNAVMESDLVFIIGNPAKTTPNLMPNEEVMKGREFDKQIRDYYASRKGAR